MDDRTPEYVELLRDLAIFFELYDKNISLKLMFEAYKLRPTGPVICKKLVKYNDEVKSNMHHIISRASLFQSVNSKSAKQLSRVIAEKNANCSCQIASYDELQQNMVTIISAVAENPYSSLGKISAHFQCLLGYAVSAAASEKIKHVQVVFTREWQGSPLLSISLFESRCASAVNILNIPNEIKRKIKFTILSSADHLPSVVSGVVIKLKSTAEHHSSYIYDKIIYDNYPVLFGAYNSEYLNDDNCDYLLVRNNSDTSECRKLYIQPSFYPIKPLTNHLSKNILTAYGGERVKLMLMSLDDEFWNQMEKIFKRGYKWLLVGFNNTKELHSFIPKRILKKYKENVVFYEYLDLDLLLPDIYAMIFSPFIYGGGGTAKLAASYQVPIIAQKDSKSSDVNLFLPNEQLFKSIKEKVDTLISWDDDSTLRTRYVSRQTVFINKKTILDKHDSNLPEVIEMAKNKYQLRS